MKMFLPAALVARAKGEDTNDWPVELPPKSFYHLAEKERFVLEWLRSIAGFGYLPARGKSIGHLLSFSASW